MSELKQMWDAKRVPWTESDVRDVMKVLTGARKCLFFYISDTSNNSCVVPVDRWPHSILTNLDMVRIKYASEILDIDSKASIYNMAKRSFIVCTHM